MLIQRNVFIHKIIIGLVLSGCVAFFAYADDHVEEGLAYEASTTVAEVAVEENVKMLTIERPPFVIKGEEGLEGFSIDLWKEITNRTGLKYRIYMEESFSEMLGKVQSGEADGAVANITITAEREKNMDFTLPIYNSGLQILLPKNLDLFSIWRPLKDPLVWEVIAILFVVWFVALHALWLSGRRSHATFSYSYPAGLYDTFAWLVIDQLRRDIPYTLTFQFMALFLRILTMVGMLLVVALFTASLTVSNLGQAVSSYTDLHGRVVGVTNGSTAQKFLQSNDITSNGYDSFETLMDDFKSGELDAVVHDAPILQYYAVNEGRGISEVTQATFKPEEFGILFSDGSLHTEKVNNALLRIKEDGTYDQLYSKWFQEHD